MAGAIGNVLLHRLKFGVAGSGGATRQARGDHSNCQWSRK
jgi:hypothetical protein